MNRRNFLQLTIAGGALVSHVTPAALSRSARADQSFGFSELDEWTLQDFHAALDSGRCSAQSLTEYYLERIAKLDRLGPALNSVIEINPDALDIARQTDQERAQSGPRGALMGIPILIKDNIGTHDRMTTTAGSLALSGSIPSRDAFIVRQLRAAGAVILGKTNLSEWANFRSSNSTSGWSGRGGLTRHPYILDRNPSGSSSGSAVAVTANLCAVAVGTETDGSILAPSSVNGIVGIKPTLGLVSRGGIVPIAHSQDTAGPMARSVTDAAILLGALAAPDPDDAITTLGLEMRPIDYTRFLDPNGLRGARVGVARKFFDVHSPAGRVLEDAVVNLRRLGADVVDPADLPSHGKFGDVEMEVLLFEFKSDLNRYLAGLGPSSLVHSLADVIAFNEKNRSQEMPYFQQEIMMQAQEKGPLSERRYWEARSECRRLARDEGIDSVMTQHRLNAIVAPTIGPASVTDLLYGDRDTGGSTEPAAVAGYPSITVPAGAHLGLPIGLSFFGRPFQEPTLLKLAFAFEQAVRARRSPRFLPSLRSE